MGVVPELTGSASAFARLCCPVVRRLLLAENLDQACVEQGAEKQGHIVRDGAGAVRVRLREPVDQLADRAATGESFQTSGRVPLRPW